MKFEEACALAHRIRALLPPDADRLPRLVGLPVGHWLVVHSGRSFATEDEWEEAIAPES